MQKVLHIIPRYYPGGAERLVLEYAMHLDQKKHKVYVASCIDDGQLFAAFKKTPASLFVGAKDKQGSRYAIWRDLKKYIKDTKPDIIHTHLLSADVIGYLAKKTFPQTQWISTLHNVEYHRPLLYRMIWKHILKRADHVIAVSPAVEAYAKRVFDIPADKLTMIPNGIDLTRWQDIDDSVLFRNTPYQLASIGRLEEQKGHVYLLEALAQLKKYKWKYHMFGDGSLQQELAMKASTLGIADRVYFHGNVSDVPIKLRSIDLIIQPSLWEGMSLTIMEAMAAGRPVLTTDAAAEGLIEHERTGFVVQKKNAEALKTVLAGILSGVDKAVKVASAGRDHALTYFGIQTHVKAVEDLYNRIMNTE